MTSDTVDIKTVGKKIAIVVLAAGRGERAGGATPKQYVRVAGKTVLERAIEALCSALPDADVQIVIGEQDRAHYRAATAGLPPLPEPVIGGSSRQQSVLHGLNAIARQHPDIVLIHDAARPFLSSALIARVVERIDDGVGVVPALPVSDTLRTTDGSYIGETVDRDGLQAMQTPQGFPFADILKAHIAMAERGETGLTDDAEVFRRAGHEVMYVMGERSNIKLTHPDDIQFAGTLMNAGNETRTGQGFDVHAFTDGDAVMLCGVRLSHNRSLMGHSDADVGLHALTDAILGAIADGDIGEHFPPSDPKWRGARSDVFVREALSRLRGRQGRLLHVDLTLICEEPKIGPHREAMRASIASLCEIDIARVSVKATTSERLGFTGRGEGIAALSTATVSLPAAP